MSAKLFAALTIVSLLMSAFPVAFFVAEAASTGVGVPNAEYQTTVGVKVNFKVSVTTDGSTTTAGTYFTVSDSAGGGDFYTGTTGGDCNSDTPDTDSKFSIAGNKGVCYKNETAGTYDIALQLFDNADQTIGELAPFKIIVEVIQGASEVIPEVIPDIYLISGYKYILSDASNSTPYAGWTIHATDGADSLSTTTDSNGYYYFEVGEGNWIVSENESIGWHQVDVVQDGQVVDTGADYDACDLIVPFESDYTCDFVNEIDETVPEEQEQEQGQELEQEEENIEEQEEESEQEQEEQEKPVELEESESSSDEAKSGGGSSSGTRIKKATPAPLVLGATTVSQCPFLLDYMQIGAENDSWEVTKLQMFLSIVMGFDTPITGEFDAATDASVKLFQELYQSEVLDPWFDLGIVPHNQPTGFVYKTTLWKINKIVCSDYDAAISFEGEDLSANIDID